MPGGSNPPGSTACPRRDRDAGAASAGAEGPRVACGAVDDDVDHGVRCCLGACALYRSMDHRVSFLFATPVWGGCSELYN